MSASPCQMPSRSRGAMRAVGRRATLRRLPVCLVPSAAHLDLRLALRHGSPAGKFELSEHPVVLGQLALALEDLVGHRQLIVLRVAEGVSGVEQAQRPGVRGSRGRRAVVGWRLASEARIASSLPFRSHYDSPPSPPPPSPSYPHGAPAVCLRPRRTCAGITEFLGMSTSITPPVVSMPSVSGITSSSSSSDVVLSRSPDRTPACAGAGGGWGGVDGLFGLLFCEEGRMRHGACVCGREGTWGES
eukprot:scaffold8628_cov111-Isochrysis_galbana.AAC.1